MADNNSNSASLIKTILFIVGGVGTLITLALVYWKMAKQAAQLAQLKHEKDVAEEDKKRALVYQKVASNDAQAVAAKTKITAIQQQITTLDDKITTINDKYKNDKEKIDALKNWSDFDAFMSNPSSSSANIPPGSKD